MGRHQTENLGEEMQGKKKRRKVFYSKEGNLRKRFDGLDYMGKNMRENFKIGEHKTGGRDL